MVDVGTFTATFCVRFPPSEAIVPGNLEARKIHIFNSLSLRVHIVAFCTVIGADGMDWLNVRVRKHSIVIRLRSTVLYSSLLEVTMSSRFRWAT